MAAADVERLVVDDALALAVLLLRAGDKRASRAAARAVARYALELPRVDLDELGLVLDGIERISRGEPGSLGLRLALDRRRLRAAIDQISAIPGMP